MIKKGMEVGAVFEDGGSYYIVEALSGENYISRRITKAEAEEQMEAKENESSAEEQMEAKENESSAEEQMEAKIIESSVKKQTASRKTTVRKKAN